MDELNPEVQRIFDAKEAIEMGGIVSIMMVRRNGR